MGRLWLREVAKLMNSHTQIHFKVQYLYDSSRISLLGLEVVH